MSLVYCKLPKAGLGNQLFPLMKAAVFAALNGLPLKVTGYRQLKIGPWLRQEKNKRRYGGFFNFEKPLIMALGEQLKLNRLNKLKWEQEPAVEKIVDVQGRRFLFNAMPHWDNYFEGLNVHRALVKQCLQQLLAPAVQSKLNSLESPCIGVHIRMGDFRQLQEDENFSTVGAVRTPEAYFIEMIQSIRKLNGSPLPVSVFTDGYAHELAQLLLLENVRIVNGNTDIVDLLLLSKSKLIVTSAGSTFSYWAAFLADAPVIMHPDHLHEALRPKEVNKRFYEGAFDGSDALLVSNVKGIRN